MLDLAQLRRAETTGLVDGRTSVSADRARRMIWQPTAALAMLVSEGYLAVLAWPAA